MTSISELGGPPDHYLAVWIHEPEKLAERLEAMVVTMKEAVAMDIDVRNETSSDGLLSNTCCFISIYHPNNTSLSAARKERLRLSAISISPEQSQTTTTATSDSVWLGIEPYAALFAYGTRFKFLFNVGIRVPQSSVKTFATDLGLSILRNAHFVQCLRLQVHEDIGMLPLVKEFFSLDAWKEGFPSLRSVYLGRRYEDSWKFDLPPHLLKHLRGLELQGEFNPCDDPEPAVLRQMESLIRNKDCAIEEVKLETWLLEYEELLDDTLRRVRSFQVKVVSEEDVDDLAASFERTKADGDNLVRLRLQNSRSRRFRTTATVERILRSRPNLQILNLDTVSPSTFVVLCPVFASSVLTTLKVGVALETAAEDKTLADGVEMLLQHPTIRDLDLTVECGYKIRKTSQMEGDSEGDSVYHFERCVAEGLRSTSLRRFHLTADGRGGASDTALTKMYETARENWNLMDIRVKGCKHSRRLPFPLTTFDFISSRNQYFSRVLMMDENTVPPGLWPLILEWDPRWGHPWSPIVDSCPLLKERYDESVLFYLLTLRPHLVKGNKVESSVDADNEKSARPKRTRTT